MRKLVVLSFLLLAGCQSTAITTKVRVIEPPEQMYDCPIKTKWADWRTLNDTEVAKTLVELYKNNSRCKASIDAIRKFIKDSKARIER